MNRIIMGACICALIISVAGCKPTIETKTETVTVTVAPTNTVREDNFVSFSTEKGSNVSSLTWNHTVAAGENRLLVATFSKRSYNTIATVTFGAATFTKLTASEGTGNSPRVEIWYLVAPKVGTEAITAILEPNAAAGSNGTNDFWEAASLDFTGVHQTSPVGTPVSAFGTTGDPTVTVKATANDLVIDVLGFEKGPSDYSAGPAQFSKWFASSDGNWSGRGSTKAGASSVVMTWKKPVPAATAPWALAAVGIKAIP